MSKFGIVAFAVSLAAYLHSDLPAFVVCALRNGGILDGMYCDFRRGVLNSPALRVANTLRSKLSV